MTVTMMVKVIDMIIMVTLSVAAFASCGAISPLLCILRMDYVQRTQAASSALRWPTEASSALRWPTAASAAGSGGVQCPESRVPVGVPEVPGGMSLMPGGIPEAPGGVPEVHVELPRLVKGTLVKCVGIEQTMNLFQYESNPVIFGVTPHVCGSLLPKGAVSRVIACSLNFMTGQPHLTLQAFDVQFFGKDGKPVTKKHMLWGGDIRAVFVPTILASTMPTTTPLEWSYPHANFLGPSPDEYEYTQHAAYAGTAATAYTATFSTATAVELCRRQIPCIDDGTLAAAAEGSTGGSASTTGHFQ